MRKVFFYLRHGVYCYSTAYIVTKGLTPEIVSMIIIKLSLSCEHWNVTAIEQPKRHHTVKMLFVFYKVVYSDILGEVENLQILCAQLIQDFVCKNYYNRLIFD